MTDYGIKRDYWDRPWIALKEEPLKYVPDRKSPVNAEAYTRISKLAGMLDDSQGLIDWVAAHAMLGLVKDEGLNARVTHLALAHKRPWYSDGKKPLKELVKRAKDKGGASYASDMGTAFHGVCEERDRGNIPDFVPRGMQPWVEAREVALSEFEPVLIEPFIINDEVKAAGNPDRYLRHKKTGIVYAADDKTGVDEPDYPLKVTIQVATASRGKLYDQRTGKRTPIECDQRRGILIHTPILTENPRSTLYWLDLTKGWELAELSATVRDKKKIAKLVKV